MIEATVAWIQIHDARIRKLVEESADSSRPLLRVHLIHRILDAGSIYAGASSAFEYARRGTNEIPKAVSWDYVEKSIPNIGLFNDDSGTEIVRRKEQSLGPFEALG